MKMGLNFLLIFFFDFRPGVTPDASLTVGRVVSEVAVGARSLDVADASAFEAGATVFVAVSVVETAFVEALGMDKICFPATAEQSECMGRCPTCDPCPVWQYAPCCKPAVSEGGPPCRATSHCVQIPPPTAFKYHLPLHSNTTSHCIQIPPPTAFKYHRVPDSQISIASLFCFQNGAKSGFEMCFDIGSRHLGCWGQNTVPYAQGCYLS